MVLEKDVVDNGADMIPWYATLAGSYSLAGFRMTWLGRTITHSLVSPEQKSIILCVYREKW